MIAFRPIFDPKPPEWVAGVHWFVEFYDDEHENPCPQGTAFVTAGPDFYFLDYVLVRDDCRRAGIGTALVAACIARWPRITLTDAVSDVGEAFLASLVDETDGIPDGHHLRDTPDGPEVVPNTQGSKQP